MENFTEHPIVKGMLNGYGPDFPSLETLFRTTLTEEDIRILYSPVPDLGRYKKNVIPLINITSARSVGLNRFQVITRYILSLANEMDRYEGGKRKIIHGLSGQEKIIISGIGNRDAEIKMAEIIEGFTDHDTAAAVDYIKLKIAQLVPDLRNHIEAAHFANTSEDVMANVFGLIGNKLVFGFFMRELVSYCKHLIAYINKFEEKSPLILPAFTHEQAAEPTTLGKKLLYTLNSIIFLIEELFDQRTKTFKPFSGKLGGAVGNMTCHFAAYPEIDWWRFSEEFVTGLGLRYERTTHQSVSYTIEAQIFTTIAHILTQIIKATDDFIKMARCPGQLFVKKKKKGQKGSSLMPNKSNAWGMEGAIKMLKKAQSLLKNLAFELPAYPDEGNMGRSYLFRDLGSAFMPIFIALNRIKREMNAYHPNHKKIQMLFAEYPGMAGSSIQTVLKRESIPGDAYRAIQDISINSDGSYADAEQFKTGLEEKMEKFNLSPEIKAELRNLTNPAFLVVPVHKRVKSEIGIMETKLSCFEEATQKL